MFEGRERISGSGGVQAIQKLRTRSAVAVLPRQRTVVRHDDVRRVLLEGPEGQPARLRQQVVVDAHVDAALAEVAIQQPVPAVAT